MVLAFVGSPAAGQLLNLDAPSAPRPGDGKAALAIAQSLFDDIAKREKALPTLQGDHLAAAEFEIATRRLVRVLLMKAEELGEPGSAHALAALTLHGRQRELDAIARRIRAGRVSTEAREAAAVFVAQVDAVGSLVPGRVEELDRALRDLFAVPVHTGLAAGALPAAHEAPVWQVEAERVGWVAAEAGAGAGAVDLAAAIGRWAAGADDGGSEAQDQRTISAELVSALNVFEAETLAPAREWWAYRGAAESTAGAIIAAGRAVEPGALPEWVPEGTRAALAARFTAAAGAALQRETRPEAMPYLADLASCVDLLTRLETLSAQATGPTRPSQRAVTSARTALLAIVGATETGSAESRSALTAFDGALRLIGQRGALGGEEELIRDARPAWRNLEHEARRTELDLWEVLGKIGSRGSGGPMSDPAVVGPLAAHRRSLGDLRAVRAISHWLNTSPVAYSPGRSPPPSGLAVQQNLAAQRVLRLGQDLSVAAERDGALTAIRRFAADLDALMLFPGEMELRTGGPAWAALTGGREADLAGRIDALRGEWLNAWVRDRKGAEAAAVAGAAEGLARCRGVMLALHDAATMREILTASPRADEGFAPGAEGTIRAWPGWELSDRAARALYDGVEPRLAGACAALLSGNASAGEAVDRAIEEFAKERAPLRLAAALERSARARRIAGVPVLVELAAPPTPSRASGPWLVGLRADLAAVCRYAEEYAVATAEKDGKRAAALREYLGERAIVALQRLEAMDRAE